VSAGGKSLSRRLSKRKIEETSPDPQIQIILEAYNGHHGNVARMSRTLGIGRKKISRILRENNLGGKPLAGGRIRQLPTEPAILPPSGKVKRYLLTSAQNNTFVHPEGWKNLLVLKKYWNAELLISTYTYNKNAYGPMAVKEGTYDPQKELFYDPAINPYKCNISKALAPDLVFCGEHNILPTEQAPISGLNTYAGGVSTILPHAKIQLESVAMHGNKPAKFSFTTGTVTKRNYIQKKQGLKGEFHHVYGAVVAEVNSDGDWWVRQLDIDERTGRICDLNLVVEKGIVTDGNSVESITWGDTHAGAVDEKTLEASVGKGGMLDTLKPKSQFIHDLMEGASVNHHTSKNPHEKYRNFKREYHIVENELQKTVEVLRKYYRENIETYIVNSNHDDWVERWARETEFHRLEPANMRIWLRLQEAILDAIDSGDDDFSVFGYALSEFNLPKNIKFLGPDDSVIICKKIECGMHGHLGPDGKRGKASNLVSIGTRANTAHSHSACIKLGLYVAGTSAKLRMGYNKGPSSWSHSHIVTYSNGKRTIITVRNGKWRA
jgi:hypothetical protein